mmetsp:Transcript_17741/g.49654  ORF Transcript_17741/g.49654 Transcript_17741/m.49654 type:complete len:244 (-) Transcript_17741:170-901(-)
MLESRRQQGIKPEDLDLISFCLRAMEEDPTLMDDRQIRSELHTMMFAGSDTTANTLGLMFLQLANRPALMERCIQEVDSLSAPVDTLPPGELSAQMPFLTAVFKETLRLWPPATMTMRILREDTVLPGSKSTLEEGDLAACNIWNVHRNPKYWTRSDEWLPQRWLPEGQAEFGPVPENAFIPFGGGSRICIGMHFALLEAQVIAVQVLRKARFEPVPGFEPHMISQVTLTSENGIKLRAVPRT